MLALPGGARIEIFAYDQPASHATRPAPSHQIGSYHLGIEVQDLEAAAQILQDNGCTLFDRIAFSEGPTAGSRFQRFSTPGRTSSSFPSIPGPIETRPSTPACLPEIPLVTRHAINPESLYPSLPFGFSHATEHTGTRSLHLAGQVAWDKDRNLVGAGDVAAQARQALENLRQV